MIPTVSRQVICLHRKLPEGNVSMTKVSLPPDVKGSGSEALLVFIYFVIPCVALTYSF